MAKARKDSRGYALRTGECERKDGRYSYSYTDKKGERHIIYGKTLALLRSEEKKLEKYLWNIRFRNALVFARKRLMVIQVIMGHSDIQTTMDAA